MCLGGYYIRMDEVDEVDEVDERIERFNDTKLGPRQSLFPAETQRISHTFVASTRCYSLLLIRYWLLATGYLLFPLDSVDLAHPGVAVDSRNSLIFCPVRWKYHSSDRKAESPL